MSAIQAVVAQPWVERLGWTLVHFLWQGAAIALLYALGRWCLGDLRSGQGRYLMACAALAAMIAAPVITFALLSPSAAPLPNPYVGRVPISSPSVTIEHASTASMETLAIRVWEDQVMPWLVVAWLAGATVFWVRLFGGWAIAARMRSRLVAPAPPEWQQKIDQLIIRVGVSRPVTLLVSAMVRTPTVVGWLRPVVLMPIGALAGLPPEHVEALLAHELAHIRRHDYLVNLLQSIAESLLFYHPAVWWISGRIRNEREVCCDEVAVSISGDALTYACALADLETRRRAHFTPALAADGGMLRDRVARLLNQPDRISPACPTPSAVVAAVLILVAAYGVFAQSPTEARSFEAPSIKPNTLGGGHAHGHNSVGRLSAQMTTKDLIQRAFGLKKFQVAGGPAWLGNDNYDFVATTGTPIVLTDKVLQPYLQSLLADRFHLKYHRETKELPVYWLVAAKNGTKLRPHTGEDERGMDSEGEGITEKMTGTKLSMEDFASFLASRMDRPVIDHSGIKGEFDVKLEWSWDDSGDSPRPSIFTALQEQLGLRLEANKGPVEILVVDSVEKPSEN